MPSPRPTVPAPNGPVSRFLHDPGAVLDPVVRVARSIGEATLPFLPFVIATVCVVALGVAVVRHCHGRARRDGARWLNIALPPKVDPASAEALWSNLHALVRPAWKRLLYGQPHICFEYLWCGTACRIGLWVPADVSMNLVRRAVESAWPTCRTTTFDEAPIPLHGEATGGTLRLVEPAWFALRTEHDADPLRAMLGAAGNLDSDEYAVVQVLARPVPTSQFARARRAARALCTGRSGNPIDRLADLFVPTRSRPRDDPSRAADVRAILLKASSPSWTVSIRYGVSTTRSHDDTNAQGTDAHRAKMELRQSELRGRAHALASSFALHTGRNSLGRHRLRRPVDVLAGRALRGGELLSVPELAALAHLPLDVPVAGLERARARAVAPPPDVPRVGKVLGDADAGQRRAVALAPADARFHVHVVGPTGVGKSNLLTNLALADIDAGRGVVVVDPKGDLITDLLDRLPVTAADRLVLFDPDQPGRPPCLNPLDGADPDLAVDHVVGIFRRIFAAYWGPRTDDVLRSACLTLMRHSGASLADVPRLLSDPRFRRPYVADIDDPVGLGGFWAGYESGSEAGRTAVVGPLLNKLRAFMLRPFVRSVVGAGRSSFDMSEVLDGGICLVRIPKGQLGDDTARLLGSFVTSAVWRAAAARTAKAQSARRDTSLYTDEAQNFLTLPGAFDEMLAEARGYRLSLVLAHQHLGQLGRELRDALSANARNKIVFSASPEDAHSFERHFAPELTAHDLSNLDAFQAAARLLVNGQEQSAFTLRTRPAPPAIPGRAQAIRSTLLADKEVARHERRP